MRCNFNLTSKFVSKTCLTNLRCFIALILFICFQSINADSQRIVDYEYDAAGNIISTTSNVLTAPPEIDVASIVPNFINRGSSIRLTATGTNLFKADISTDSPDLSIEITDTQLNQIDFLVTATELAALGPANFTFTTRLGVDSISIEVVPAFDLQLQPSPTIVGVGETENFAVVFPQPLIQQRNFEFSILDSAIATVTPLSESINLAENSAQISVNGLSEGTTQLIVQSPLLVYEEFSLRVQESEALSGDIYNISPQVSVVVGSYDGTNIDNPIISSSVRIIVPDFNSSTISPLSSYSVPVIVGPVLREVTPDIHTVGSTTIHILAGVNLQDVNSVALESSVDITIDSFSINPNGDEITVQITSDAGANIGDRDWIINTSTGEVTTSINTRLKLNIQ